jgi:hypothetical protein
LQNGAPYIERADKLVQLIAKQKGLSNPVIDGIVALVDSRLEANRKKAGGSLVKGPEDLANRRQTARQGVENCLGGGYDGDSLSRFADGICDIHATADLSDGRTAKRLKRRQLPPFFACRNVMSRV